MTNYTKAKIDSLEQNSKWVLRGKIDETVNRITSGYCNEAEKNNRTKHNWLGNQIHGELCKRLNFYYTTKYYMLKPELVLENKTHEILLDFEMQTDYLTQPSVKMKKITKNELCHLEDIPIAPDHTVKTKDEKKTEKSLELVRKPKKHWK